MARQPHFVTVEAPTLGVGLGLKPGEQPRSRREELLTRASNHRIRCGSCYRGTSSSTGSQPDLRPALLTNGSNTSSWALRPSRDLNSINLGHPQVARERDVVGCVAETASW